MKYLFIAFSFLLCSNLFSQEKNIQKIAFDFLPPVSKWENIDSSWYNSIHFEFEEMKYSLSFDYKNAFLNYVVIYDTIAFSDGKNITFDKKNKWVKEVLYDSKDNKTVYDYYYTNDTLERLYSRIQDTAITTYYDHYGNVSDVYYFVNGKTVKMEIFYKSGLLSSLFLYEKNKIVSIEQFDPDGVKLEDVNLDENGNGMWLKCAEDGSYCCECEVKRGKSIDCEEYISK